MVCAAVLLAGCGQSQRTGEQADAAASGAAGEEDENAQGAPAGGSSQETAQAQEVGWEGMEPVEGSLVKDGVYQIQVDSSSSMFNITSCTLKAESGQLTAVMTLSGTGYLKLFMGTSEEASEASEDQCIPYETDDQGAYTYEVSVEALDMPLPCAAFSKRKESWYDRTLVFRADSLPPEAFAEGVVPTAESLGLADGVYQVEVELQGGSGRASVDSPARLEVKDGKVQAVIAWGSSNYDYMKVDGVRYDGEIVDGQSVFTIPVTCFDWSMAVIADTTAMSQPHEIEYSLRFDSGSLREFGAEESGTKERESASNSQAPSWSEIDSEGGIPLSYATQFSIKKYPGGCRLITIADGERYLVVPENGDVPENVDEDVTVLQQPINRIYLAATSAMDLFRALDGLDEIRLSGTQAKDWYIPEAREAMEKDRIFYAGKYSAPDYELLYSEGCDLAVESTMIDHSPKVKEQLQSLGIPVFVERSSYEQNPLGRMEWLKVYGVLLGKEEQANALYEKTLKSLSGVLNQPDTGKTAAFFYISSNGSVNVRKSGDYVAEMIRMAGGTYAFEDLSGDNALSTINMQMEDFYMGAKDADVLIYNSTIDGQIYTIEELLQKSSLLGEFKAVKEGNVWCTQANLFQSTMGFGDMIKDIHAVLTDPEAEGLTYLYRLEGT